MSNYDLATNVSNPVTSLQTVNLVMPIVQSTTYKYDSSETMAKLFDLAEPGYFYTRLANQPTTIVAQKFVTLKVA